MCIVIICYPVCNVMNLEFNFRFLIKPFFHKNLNVLRTKRAYEKGFSSKQIKNFFGRFNILNRSLLLAKLSAYGFDKNSLSFVQSCFTNNIQRCYIENDFSSWCEIAISVPNVYIKSLFNCCLLL